MWDTTWNCQSGRLTNEDAAVSYDPWGMDSDPKALGIDNGPAGPLGKPGPRPIILTGTGDMISPNGASKGATPKRTKKQKRKRTSPKRTTAERTSPGRAGGTRRQEGRGQ